jgi:hypothetical protein
MQGLRRALVALPAAAAIAAGGLALGTSNAHAFIVSGSGDQCGTIIGKYNFWSTQFDNDFVASDGELTPVVENDWAQIVYYRNLYAATNCP